MATGFIISLTVTSFFLILIGSSTISGADAAYWCVARSEASYEALQTALDYACATGADCTPILSNGLCFLPNTIQAHASYAFNSFFQRKAMAPGSCDFAGSATIAQTDPSYGSCVYPSSLSTAGGASTPIPTNTNTNSPMMPTTPTTTNTPPTFNNGGIGGINPVYNPTTSSTPNYSKAYCSRSRTRKILIIMLFFTIISLTSQTM